MNYRQKLATRLNWLLLRLKGNTTVISYYNISLCRLPTIALEEQFNSISMIDNKVKVLRLEQIELMKELIAGVAKYNKENPNESNG